MKYQALFSLKSNDKVYMNVVHCDRDWRFKGLIIIKYKIVWWSYAILTTVVSNLTDKLCIYSKAVLWSGKTISD